MDHFRSLGRRLGIAAAAVLASALPVFAVPAFAATLDVTDGVVTFTAAPGEASNLTMYISGASYVLADYNGNTTALTAGAIAAGFKGNGTKTITGPTANVTGSFTFNLGDMNDIFNLRATNNEVFVNGDEGNDTVNVSSNAPTNSGNLVGIAAAVMVVGGDGVNTLWVSDVGATSGNAAVVVDADSIEGLAGPTDNTSIGYSGISLLRVSGSGGSGVAEAFTINAPGASFQLAANGGADDVTISGDTTGTMILGAGDDTLTVLSGVTLYGNVYGGIGTNTYYYGEPEYGTITGTVN